MNRGADMLELYTHPMSPCAQKVRIVLAEKGLQWTMVMRPRLMEKTAEERQALPRLSGKRSMPIWIEA